MGKDPETIETNFFCIQMARLAYEIFCDDCSQNVSSKLS
jgi:hypothetical protein